MRIILLYVKIGHVSDLAIDIFVLLNFIYLSFFSLLAGTYANVTVSVIFGFLNFLLWLSCVWFIYKETKFFKNRNAQQQQPPQNNFSNISGPPTMHQPQAPGTMN